MTVTKRTARLPSYLDEVSLPGSDGEPYTLAVIADADAGFAVRMTLNGDDTPVILSLAEVKALRDAFINVIATANGR